MNVNKISKIFIEQDEEIVFVVENIINAPSDRVIVVVPNVSALTSSAVSLKILSKQILKSNKLVVLVSDNINARHMAEKANMVVKAKMSDVTTDAWAEARDLKSRQLDELEKLKKELLGGRTPGIEVDIKEGPIAAKVVDAPEDVKAEEEIKPIMERPRQKPKIVDINAIKFVAGGDIADMPELLDIERRRMNDDDISVNDEAMEDALEKESKESDLVGTDVDAIIRKHKRQNFKLGLPKFKLSMPTFFKKLGSGWGIRIILAAIIIFLGYSVYAYFSTSTVAFTIYLNKTTSPISKNITADTSAVQNIPDKATIVAENLSKQATQTGTSVPTGTGQTGSQATGQVTIFNLKATSVQLPAGTVLTEQKTGTGLKYTLPTAVMVPATSGGTLGKVDSVAITSLTFGTQYNLSTTTPTPASIKFAVGSYNINTEVYAEAFSDVTGGTTQNTTIVSKDDVDALKATISDQLKISLMDQLKSLLSSDDILLTGSEKYNEDSFKTSVAVGSAVTTTGTDSDNVQFTAELKMTLTAIKISKTDLNSIAKSIVELANQSKTTSSVQSISVSISDPIIENVKIDGAKATFDMRTNATIFPDLKVDDLKNLVAGKSVDEAKALLGRFGGVQNVRAIYNPPYIPYAIQKVPDDVSRISISTTEYIP